MQRRRSAELPHDTSASGTRVLRNACPSAQHEFHCTLAFPVVRQERMACMLGSSQGVCTPAYEAELVRWPSARTALARTLSFPLLAPAAPAASSAAHRSLTVTPNGPESLRAWQRLATAQLAGMRTACAESMSVDRRRLLADSSALASLQIGGRRTSTPVARAAAALTSDALSLLSALSLVSAKDFASAGGSTSIAGAVMLDTQLSASVRTSADVCARAVGRSVCAASLHIFSSAAGSTLVFFAAVVGAAALPAAAAADAAAVAL
mmetsp:Transcript_11848/g.38956  ORF Transcript_11848/g.38956 Transcript_11848/m.38956 type:complete len:265 (-) Transcript_11848:92-886(-)